MKKNNDILERKNSSYTNLRLFHKKWGRGKRLDRLEQQLPDAISSPRQLLLGGCHRINQINKDKNKNISACSMIGDFQMRLKLIWRFVRSRYYFYISLFSISNSFRFQSDGSACCITVGLIIR